MSTPDHARWDPDPGLTLDPAMTPVRFSRKYPDKTIPLCWAEELLMDWFQSAPSIAGNKLAEVVKRWSVTAYGQDGSDE